MTYEGLTLLNNIREAQEETALLLREMVEHQKEVQITLKILTALAEDMSARLSALEAKGSE